MFASFQFTLLPTASGRRGEILRQVSVPRAKLTETAEVEMAVMVEVE